jgi:hypothetical protein
MDISKKVTLYVVVRLREVAVSRLMHLMYLIDRELYYMCGFTMFPWRVVSKLRSFDVYEVVDELVDLGYLDKVADGVDITYRLSREDVKVELPKPLKDVVDKVIEKTKGVDNLEEYVVKLIDPNIVEVAGLRA